MFPSVLIVVRVLAKTGVSPPFACASNSYWSPPQNISSRSNISQPQSVSGPITATQRHRVQPDRAATSADMNLSEPRISTDNIARRPRCREPPNCLALKTANPDREIDLFALLDQVLPFFLSFFCLHALSSAISVVKSGKRKVVVTPQVFKEWDIIRIVRGKQQIRLPKEKYSRCRCAASIDLPPSAAKWETHHTSEAVSPDPSPLRLPDCSAQSDCFPALNGKFPLYKL